VNIPSTSKNIIDPIPSSNTDGLLQERGFDLLQEYLHIITEGQLVPGLIVELATGTGRTSAILAGGIRGHHRGYYAGKTS